MEHLFVDTSFLLARFSPKDANHDAALAVVENRGENEREPTRWIFTDYAFNETVTTALA